MSQNVLFQKVQRDYVNKNPKLLTVDEIQKALQPIFKKYNIHSAKLFGSYCKGRATKDSDIDLVVEYDIGTKAFTRMDFMDEAETALGKKIDFINSRTIPEKLKKDIEKEGVALYVKI